MLFQRIATPSISLFFALVSCTSKQTTWEVSETRTRHTAHQAFKLSHKPDNIFRGMELEFVRTASGLRSYLNVHSLKFAEDIAHTKKTEIVLISNGNERHYLADRLEGGQRLLLTPEAQDFLLNQLAENHSVRVVSGRFDVEVSPAELPLHLTKLRR